MSQDQEPLRQSQRAPTPRAPGSAKKWLIIGAVALVVIIIIVVIVIYVMSSSKTTPATTQPIIAVPPPVGGTAPIEPKPLVDTTTPPPITPPAAVSGREYEVYPGGEITDPSASIGSSAFRSTEESKRICDAMDDCAGFARYRGQAWYRSKTLPSVVAWQVDPRYPDDASYKARSASAPAPPRRTYAFTLGKDATWVGKDDTIGLLPFRNVAESSRICDTMDGCAAFVRFGGQSYYRPNIATQPYTWGASHPVAQFPEDGSYVPN